MLNINRVILKEFATNSPYVQPLTIEYDQNGTIKTWDLIKAHESVSVIIFNSSRNVLVCVKQFRPGVYLNSIPIEDRRNPIDVTKYPPSLGVTLEFCSGIVDKNLSLPEIAAQEVFEECGYQVDASILKEVNCYRNAVGISGDKTTLFWVEVTDEMKTGSGGGVELEFIHVTELSILDAANILEENTNTHQVSGEFLYGLAWFLKMRDS